MASQTPAQKLPVTAITIAALTAVAFWSLKPIFISIIGERGDFAEVYVASGAISVAVSILGVLILRKKSLALIRGGRATLSGVASAALSGLFLALWYYGFYRALYGAPKVDATIIAFTWPLIAVVVMPLLSPSTAPKLKWAQWLMVLASFVGAAAIGVSNLGVEQAGSGPSGEIIWAFIAALGSGLYLPFAINATKSFDSSVKSRPISTFYAISVANAVALGAVLTALQFSGHTLRFYAFDAQVLFVCALIGIGTYLIAEITWTWAFQEYKSLTLSSLPYFSPAVSVVLLYLFFDEPVRPIAIVGLVLILFSNLTLHARHRSTNALSLSLVATVYVALAAQIIPVNVLASVPEMAAAITGLFAILAGFTLSRVAQRRTEELDARATLVRRLIATDSSDSKDGADELLQHLIELEFEHSIEAKEARAARIRQGLAADDEHRSPAQESALEAFNRWMTIHMDRLSTGERAALWLTGLGSIVFVLLLRGDSPLANVGAIVFAGGAFLAMFAIGDYDRNNIHGFKSQLWRLEQGFREIGKQHYVPKDVLANGEIGPHHLRGGIRTSSSDGGTRLVEELPSGRGFRGFYLGTAALVILGVMLVPTTTVSGMGSPGAAAPRPGEPQGEVEADGQALMTIGDPGWPAASVSASVIRQVLEDRGVRVQVEAADHLDIIAQLGTSDPALHVHPDLWLQNQSLSIREQVIAGDIQLSDSSYTGTQGIYVLDAQGSDRVLNSLDDLGDPDVAALFDTNGDGVGEMWIGPRGWASTQNLELWLDGLDHELIEGEAYSTTIFKARLERDAGSGAPLLFYGYEPDGIHEQFSPRLLGPIPGGTPAGGDDVDAHVAWSDELSQISPTADRVLADVDFHEDDLSGFINAVETQDLDPDEVAEQWIADNAERVNSWGQNSDD